MRDEGARGWLPVVGAAILAAAVWWISGSLFWGVLALLTMLLAQWRQLFPVAFELDHRGVTCRWLGRARLVPWEAIGHYELHPRGVLLLPVSEPAPLEYFRGLFIPWGAEQDKVIGEVRRYLGQTQGSFESSSSSTEADKTTSGTGDYWEP